MLLYCFDIVFMNKMTFKSDIVYFNENQIKMQQYDLSQNVHKSWFMATCFVVLIPAISHKKSKHNFLKLSKFAFL